ncbi:ESX secretion-associated protein EspG [Actinokineospora fastidiosa]|nr:ESX secretion-associated protein EspG [Actinokineospora fastidiosa]
MMPFGAVEAEPVTLTALEFDVLWEHLAPGAMPLIVKVPSPGKTHEERAAIEDGVWRGLAARGVDRDDPEIAEVFGLLARPEREVDGRLWAGRGVRLLACSREDAAALAVLAGDTLRLSRISALGLAAAAVGELPSAPAGPGRSVTLRTADFEAAAQGDGTVRGFEGSLLGRGVRADDAAALAEMIGDVLHTGNFGAAVRDRLGRRVRGERVVSFFDTAAGRYVQIRRASPDGELWTTISPADSRKLTHHVDELLRETAE